VGFKVAAEKKTRAGGRHGFFPARCARGFQRRSTGRNRAPISWDADAVREFIAGQTKNFPLNTEVEATITICW